MWTTIDPTVLPLSPKEIDLVDGKLGAATLPGIVAAVTDQVRGYVAAKNVLGPEGTIPSELVSAAKAIIVEEYLAQVPSDTLLTETRLARAKSARAMLGDVATGKMKVEAATTLSVSQPSPQIETVESGARGDSREDLRRL